MLGVASFFTQSAAPIGKLTSVRIGVFVPLCRINLNGAGVGHDSEQAIWSDARKALEWIRTDGQATEFREWLPLSVGNRQSINSRFCSRLCFLHCDVERLGVARPNPVSKIGFKLLQVCPSGGLRRVQNHTQWVHRHCRHVPAVWRPGRNEESERPGHHGNFSRGKIDNLETVELPRYRKVLE